MKYWAVAQSPIPGTTVTVERLKKTDLHFDDGFMPANLSC